ncbi:TPA: Abi family protein [Vibrio vulnificus]|nr:Abi family protein [Vibrio vulnificus]
MPLTPPKQFKHYEELIDILIERGMVIDNRERAIRKLAQVGYYRLSGFWYPARVIQRDESYQPIQCEHLKRPKRLNHFQQGTEFDQVFNLYLFDKKLRLAMLDGLERIEIFVRSVIAHELGRGKKKQPGTGEDIPEPLAWKDSDYINGKFLKKRGHRPSLWEEWQNKHSKLIERSQEDCIVWHKKNEKEMPFWVVIEAWDFGTMSKYYGMLKDQYRQRICSRLGIEDKTETDVLRAWLMEMNILRNRCAHHTRIWNQQSSKVLKVTSHDSFEDIRENGNTLSRLYGVIRVMWFLIEQIGPSSCWFDDVNNLIEQFPQVPGCPLSSLGMPVS